MAHDDGTKPTDRKFTEMSGHDKAWLEKVMKECVIDEVELMAQAVAVLKGAPPSEAYADASDEIRARVDRLEPASDELLLFQQDMLEDLQERVEHIDNARTFVKIGGVQPILDVLREGAQPLRWRAAAVLASLFQNNPPTQDAGLQHGAIGQLAAIVRRSTPAAAAGGAPAVQSDKTRLKAFNALSCLVRAHEPCEQAFLADGTAAAAAVAAPAAEAGGGGGGAAAAAAAGAGAGAGESMGEGGGIALLHELLHAEESLHIRIKAAFCLRWFCFAQPSCIGRCVACGLPALLAAQLHAGSGGGAEAHADNAGFAADMREKALDALLQMVEGDEGGSGGALAAVRLPALGVAATLEARIGKLAALTGEDVENAHEELSLARRLAELLRSGTAAVAPPPPSAPAAVDVASLAAAASKEGGPVFTLK
jgi:hypothetical protein